MTLTLRQAADYACAFTRTYRVKDVAALASVSIRTLHYYDEIGLLVPKHRTASGYRLYDDEDLFRLQQILIGRELELSLEDIRRSLDEPSFDRRRALLAQKSALEECIDKTEAVIASIVAALALLINRWFYPCSRFRHQGLAGLYESDERFRTGIDAHGAGLATFLVAAIRANAASQQRPRIVRSKATVKESG